MSDEGTYPYTIPTLERPADAPHVAVVVLPNEAGEWSAQTIDFEPYQPHPRRRQAAITVRDVDSFIAYVMRQQESGTIAFADLSGGLKAIINHHEPSAFTSDGGHEAGWRDHTVTLAREQTTVYKAWVSANSQWMKQEAFAEFLERRMGEIITPNGAELLEVAKFFQSNTTIGFSSGRQLHNGQVQLHYVENIEERGGTAGDLAVPTDFTVLLRPYKDAKPPADGHADTEQFVVGARLRWRVAQNAVTFMFVLGEELELFMDGLHNSAIARVEGETGITVLRGSNG